MRIDSTTLETYKRVGKTADGQQLLQHWGAELNATTALLMTAPVEQLPRLQGKAALLAELLEAFRS